MTEDEKFLKEMERYCSFETKQLCRMVRARDVLLRVAITHIEKDRQHYHLKFCGRDCPNDSGQQSLGCLAGSQILGLLKGDE